MMRWTLSPIALACALSCGMVHATGTQEIALPLTGPAYQIADMAYQAFARGDFDTAIKYAREAIRLRPDVARLKTLLQDAQTGAQRKQQTGKPGAIAPAAAKTDTSTLTAIDAATQSLNVAAVGDLTQALRLINRAISQAPQVIQYRLMQIDLLIRLEQFAQAETATATTLKNNSDADDTIMPAILHAYLLQRRGQYDQARSLYNQVLQSDALGDDDMRNVRLIIADAAMAAQDSALVMTALEAIPETDIAAQERRQFAKGSDITSLSLQVPALRCVVNRFGPVCSLFAGERPSQLLANKGYQLANQGRQRDALALFEQALLIGGSNKELEARRDNVRHQMAQTPATQAFQALARNDVPAAEQAINQAIAYAPDVMSYRVLHMQTLILLKQYKAAEQAANVAIDLDKDDVVPLVLRAYLRQLQGRYAEASKDYKQALSNDTLSDDDLRNLRLYIADATLAAGDKALSKSILTSLPAGDNEALWRRSLLDMQASGKPPALLAPYLDFRTTPYGTMCTLAPSESAPNALITAIYQAQKARQFDKALNLANQLYDLAPNNDGYRRVLVQALAAAGRKEQSRELAAGLNKDSTDLSFAYMAMMAGAPEMALQTFQQADAAGKLPPKDLQNAAFAALNANERRTASGYFKRAIDAVANDNLKLTPQELLETRRAVSEVDRQWGAYISASYRGSNNMQAGQNQTATVGDNLQIGTEAYWRPEAYNRDGKYIDLYGRLSGTAYSASNTSTNTQTGSTFIGKPPVGLSTMTSAVGIRWKPLAAENLVLSFERQQAIGSDAQSDWLARIGYSYSKGTDLRADSKRWTTTQLFAETGYYLQSKAYYFTSELQSGSSFLLPEKLLNNATLLPHFVIGADYNTGYTQPLAVGAGLGVNMRYWFREDRYHAPQSYFDISLQYRRKIAGDERASGWFLRSILSY